MTRYLIEVTGKFIWESRQVEEQVAADVYARIEESFRNSDDLLDIEIATYLLPDHGAPD